MQLFLLLLLITPAACSWQRVGPRNIFDDENNRGEAGTLADAASPSARPNIIYTGGQNNGASSGILKTVDMGENWHQASNGLWDTRVNGIFVNDDQGVHVYCGTPTGIWESVDGAASWKFVNGSGAFGTVHSFRKGKIGGDTFLLAGTTAGIANIPISGGNWKLIPSPRGDWRTPLSISSPVGTKNSVVAGCLDGVVYLGEIQNTTGAEWEELDQMACAVVAIDPKDKDHFLYSNSSGWTTWESTDGGKTSHNLHHPTGSFYVAIDQQGWYYTGAEAGAYRSMDGGKTWEAYVVNMTSREKFTDNRIPHDYQRIVLDFAGNGVAFPSDQGLFIKPPGDQTSLINANGNMSNNIAIRVAVSEGEGGNRYLVMTVWDWNVIASWDSGSHWPATPCAYWDEVNSCDGAPANIGEGGAAYSMGHSNHVVLLHYHNIYYSSRGGKGSVLTVLPNNANAHSSELVYTRTTSERSEPAGAVYTVMTMDVVNPTPSPPPPTPAPPTPPTPTPPGVQCACLTQGKACPQGFTCGPCNTCECQDPSCKPWARRTCYWQNGIAHAHPHEQGRARDQTKHTRDDASDTSEDQDDDDDQDGDEDAFLKYMRFGEQRDENPNAPWMQSSSNRSIHGRGKSAPATITTATAKFLLKSANFGQNWSWVRFPDALQDVNLVAIDPTNPNILFAIAPSCLATSSDQGESWSTCQTATGLQGSFSSLVIKDSSTMIMLRNADVPLRTKDGGKTWQALSSCAKVSTAGYTRAGSYSWSGKTLVIHGRDNGAPSRGEYAGYVWKSADDGDTWTDETDDLVTMAVNSGTWFEKDFYLTTSGEGILLKPGFEV